MPPDGERTEAGGNGCRTSRWIALVLLLLAAGLGAAVCLGPHALVQGVDDGWHDLMARHETQALVGAAHALDWIASWRGTTLVGLVVGLVMLRGGRWRDLLLWVGGILVAEGVVMLTKAISARPRPVDALAEAIGSAFPSGHATVAAVLAFLGAALFAPAGRPRRIGLALALVYVLAVAWSRTYLRVHWLSDVTAGALLGTGVALLATSMRVHASAPGPRGSPLPAGEMAR